MKVRFPSSTCSPRQVKKRFTTKHAMYRYISRAKLAIPGLLRAVDETVIVELLLNRENVCFRVAAFQRLCMDGNLDESFGYFP